MIHQKNIQAEIRKYNLDKPINKSAFIHIFVHLGVLIALLYCAFYFYEESNLLFLFFAFFYLQVYHFLGMAGLSHELLHNNVFRTALLNRMFYNIFSLLSWNNANYFHLTHWEHHKHTLGEKDPKDLFRGKVSLLNLFNWIFFDFQSFRRRIYFFILNSCGIVPKVRKSGVQKVQLFAIWTLIFHFIVFCFSIYSENYLFIIFINLAPFLCTFLNKVLAISQHYRLQNIESGVSNDYFKNSRSIKLGKVVSFFYANMNYHIEHHLFPNVPFYNLPELQKVIIKQRGVNHVCSIYSYLKILFGPSKIEIQ
jgi:fatty acid desaturase